RLNNAWISAGVAASVEALPDLAAGAALAVSTAGSVSTPISSAATQTAAASSLWAMAVLPLIGRCAARYLAADDPVLVSGAGHRPFRVHIEGCLVAPLFY